MLELIEASDVEDVDLVLEPLDTIDDFESTFYRIRIPHLKLQDATQEQLVSCIENLQELYKTYPYQLIQDEIALIQEFIKMNGHYEIDLKAPVEDLQVYDVEMIKDYHPPPPKQQIATLSNVCIGYKPLLFIESILSRDYGTPSSLFVRNGVFIGTMKSYIILLHPTLKYVLGSTFYGAVTCMAMCPEGKLLVAGYGRGTVIVWDLTRRITRKVLEPISCQEQIQGKDGHGSCRIIKVEFLSSSEFVSADAQGVIYYHSLGLLYKRYRLHGQRPTTEKPLPSTIYSMSTSQHYIAFSTPFKLAVISMKPEPVMIYRSKWKAEKSIVKFNDDLLGFSQDHIIGIISNGEKKTRELESVVVSLHWLHDYLVCFSQGKISFFDKDLQCVETCEFPRFSLFSFFREKIYYLDQEQIYVSSLFDYKYRLSKLQEQGEYEALFEMAIDWYQDEPKWVHTGEIDKQELSKFIFQLLDTIKEELDIKLILKTAFGVGLSEWVFFQGYEYLKTRAGFYEAFEEWCLQGISILNPLVINDLLEHGTDRLERMNDILLALNPFELDVNFTSQFTQKHLLYPSFIHIHSRVLDYITPIEYLLQHPGIHFFYIYLSNILTGKSFIGYPDNQGHEIVSNYLFEKERVLFLLQKDPIEFLGVVSIVFENYILDMPMQTLLNLFLEIFHEFPSLELGIFLAKCYSLYRNKLSFTFIPQLFDFLLNDEMTPERENALLDLVRNGHDPQLPIHIYKDKKCFKLYEFYCLKSYAFQELFDCLLQQKSEKLFSIFNDILKKDLVFEQLMNLKNYYLNHSKELLELNCHLFCELLIRFWPLQVYTLEFQDKHYKLLYLKGLLKQDHLKEEYYNEYFELLTDYGVSEIMSFLKTVSQMDKIPLDYLKAIDICRTKDLLMPLIWLLDRIGSYKEALEMCFKDLKNTISLALDICEKSQLWYELFSFYYLEFPNDDLQVLDLLLQHSSLSNFIHFLQNHALKKPEFIALLQNHSFSQQLFSIVLSLSNQYAFDLFETKKQLLSVPLVPKKGVCQICGKLLHLRAMTSGEKFEKIVFLNDFLYHSNCVLTSPSHQTQLKGKSKQMMRSESNESFHYPKPLYETYLELKSKHTVTDSIQL